MSAPRTPPPTSPAPDGAFVRHSCAYPRRVVPAARSHLLRRGGRTTGWMAAMNTTMRGAAGRRSAAGVPRFTAENPMHGQADPEENVRRSMRTDPEFLERPRTAGGQTDVRYCPPVHLRHPPPLCHVVAGSEVPARSRELDRSRAGSGLQPALAVAQDLLAVMPPHDKQSSLTRGGLGWAVGVTVLAPVLRRVRLACGSASSARQRHRVGGARPKGARASVRSATTQLGRDVTTTAC